LGLAGRSHQTSRTKSTGQFIENGSSALRAVFVHVRDWGAISFGSTLSINESGKSRLGYNKNYRKAEKLIFVGKTPILESIAKPEIAVYEESRTVLPPRETPHPTRPFGSAKLELRGREVLEFLFTGKLHKTPSHLREGRTR
jgi:hypothetical protein